MSDRLDEVLLRFEVWRQQPAVLAGLVIIAFLLTVSGWWFARSGPATPVEDLLPVAQPDGSAQLAAGSAGSNPDGTSGGLSEVDPAPGEAGAVLPPEPGSVVIVGSEAEVQAAQRIVVHVVGSVMRPGLVRLRPESRIDDAVAAAGGPTPDADIQRLNLAAPVDDGMQIRVPSVGDETTEPLVMTPDRPAVGEPAGPAAPLNINTATSEALQDLPGVGPATAAAILAWRTEHGAFLTVDDLTLVPGIGPAKLAALRDRVTI